MYSFDSRIRYSEVDPEGYLKIESLIDYFQDCCSFQSEDGGVGLAYTKEHHIAWLVNFWQVEILRRPRLGEKVRTTTIPYDFKAFMGYRNCVMDVLTQKEETAEAAVNETVKEERTGGAVSGNVTAEPGSTASERIAISNSVWSLINLDKGMPVRIPPEMFHAYPLDPKVAMEYLPRKIRLPGTEPVKVGAPIPVTEAMIDSNHHVNNGQYVRMALSYLPRESRIRRVCVEYVRQAREKDVIIPEIYGSEDNMQQTVNLCSQDDRKPYAVVQIWCS